MKLLRFTCPRQNIATHNFVSRVPRRQARLGRKTSPQLATLELSVPSRVLEFLAFQGGFSYGIARGSGIPPRASRALRPEVHTLDGDRAGGGDASAMARLTPHRTVLLVEDDDDIAETLAELLCEVGREVVMPKDGEQALEKLKAIDPPCLILLDPIMPRMDGFQVIDVERLSNSLLHAPSDDAELLRARARHPALGRSAHPPPVRAFRPPPSAIFVRYGHTPSRPRTRDHVAPHAGSLRASSHDALTLLLHPAWLGTGVR
jgi:CheY-like chemotaxis protein